ncbi:MAG: hypothetical protein DRJ03_08870 [Chloroflexi bacterium]|nr:MAG: hypothetical protein DRI81_00665 [Chloroflexota bacterium]RLC86420.1 MAG: hypothetical protein DRJ03_08870 [Chloroflexota bacterium]
MTATLRLVEALGAATYSSQAARVIRAALNIDARRRAIPALEQLGWWAGGGAGTPVRGSGYTPLPPRVSVADLRVFYLRTYYLALNEARRDSAWRDAYARDLRGITRLFWRGDFTRSAFVTTFSDDVAIYLRRAWQEGAALCGVSPEELSAPEQTELEMRINALLPHVISFADLVEKRTRAQGYKFSNPGLQARLGTWITRYDELRTLGQLRACADQKLQWRRHLKRVTKESCIDCLRLDARVYRAATWRKWGVRPQSRDLACGGWRCGCGFAVVTDVPSTPGHPPRLQGQK